MFTINPLSFKPEVLGQKIELIHYPIFLGVSL